MSETPERSIPKAGTAAANVAAAGANPAAPAPALAPAAAEAAAAALTASEPAAVVAPASVPATGAASEAAPVPSVAPAPSVPSTSGAPSATGAQVLPVIVTPERANDSSADAPADGAADAAADAASDAASVEDSRDGVEAEGPDSDERLWAAANWLAIALLFFLPPLPPFLAPMLVRRLRRRASEFVSAHAASGFRFAMIATVLQWGYVLAVILVTLTTEGHWRAIFFPALAVYLFCAAGLVAWLSLVGHNAWKGRRNAPHELRKLVLYR